MNFTSFRGTVIRDLRSNLNQVEFEFSFTRNAKLFLVIKMIVLVLLKAVQFDAHNLN